MAKISSGWSNIHMFTQWRNIIGSKFQHNYLNNNFPKWHVLLRQKSNDVNNQQKKKKKKKKLEKKKIEIWGQKKLKQQKQRSAKISSDRLKSRVNTKKLLCLSMWFNMQICSFINSIFTKKKKEVDKIKKSQLIIFFFFAFFF